MATTQNTYTGNGSTTNYSFTFPYLETTDIKVSVNGTPTTAYTLANATTVQFNSAPANGASIRIYRETDDSALSSAFYAGSAIRAEDLTDNFNQNLYVVQELNNYGLSAVANETVDGAYTFTQPVTVPTPTADTHAVTRAYVNNIVANGIGDGDKGDIVVSGSGSVLSIDAGVIVDADVNASAAIGLSKLATGALPTAITVASANLVDETIVNADVNASAAIASSKLAFTQAGTGAVARTVDSKLKDVVSVKDFGAIGDGVADDTAAFSLAAASATTVLVPKGTYLITGATASAYWYLNAGVEITGLSDLSDSQVPTATINNLSRLTGRVFCFRNAADGLGIQLGDSDPWMEQFIRPSSISRAELAVQSPYGQIAVTGASKTSDNPATVGTDLATIGGNFYAINDRASVGSETCTAYAIYAEARRRASGGAAFGMELDIANQEGLQDFAPQSPLSPATPFTGGILISSGAGLSSGSLFPASFGLAFGSNGSSFDRGIVFNSGSLSGTGTLEALSLPLAYKIAWYNGTTLRCTLDQRQHIRFISSDTAGVGVENINTRTRDSLADTVSLDLIYQNTSYGYTNGAAYKAGQVRVLQRSAFSGGNALFSLDLTARNTDGSESQLTLNGIEQKTFCPSTSNTISLGASNFLFSNTYSTNFRPGNGSQIWTTGAGSPEAVVTAPIGSLYTRTDGGAGTTLYIKESGGGNTGWVAK